MGLDGGGMGAGRLGGIGLGAVGGADIELQRDDALEREESSEDCATPLPSIDAVLDEELVWSGNGSSALEMLLQ